MMKIDGNGQNIKCKHLLFNSHTNKKIKNMYIRYIVYFTVLAGGGVRLNKYWNVEREREREKKIHNFMNKKKYSLSNYRTGFAMIAL